MLKYTIPWYIFTIGLLNLVVKTHLTSHSNSHEYISANGRYFDDFSFIEREISGLPNEIGDNKKFQIKFDPSSLDFRQRPLGVPHIRKVHLFNYDTNKSIDMTSISGSTVHFHSSFFNDKKIPPMGNTSFNVVFLGREEGYIESCLFIHTNNGHFKYNVKGVSVHSPYFLRPIVDVKVPLNVTFSPLIYLHNPHSEPIQIMEIYTSGGDFHLELPTGETEGPKKLWELAPYETKAVIRVKFPAKIEQNYTAYVRIRVNVTEEILVVPLEIEVGPKNGIYTPQGYLDFGISGSIDRSKTINLCLVNTFTKPIKIQSVSTNSKAIEIDFKEPFLLQPNVKGKCVNIANLTVDWKKAFKYEDLNGKIEIKYRNGKNIVDIPYFLTVLEGGLLYDNQITKYFVNDKTKRNLSRDFKLKNEFKNPISVLNSTLSTEAQKYFKIENFESLTLKSQEERKIFTINLKPNVKLVNSLMNSYIEIKTNISTLHVPIVTYKGTLKLFLPFKSKDYSLDVGLISFNMKKEVNFLLFNENPVNIRIKGIKTSIPLTSTSVIGCGKSDPKSALLHHSFEHLHPCTIIRPNEYAILKLTVQTANNEGHVWGETQIDTDYEHLSIPVQFKVAAGKLEIGPDRLVFDQCFPGKICSHPLRVHSTFNEPMIIKNIVSLPPDSRLSCKHNGHILAHTTKIVGHLYLNPNVECGNECYTGLNQETHENWLKTISPLPKNLVNFDLDLFNTLYNRFLNTTSNGLKKWQNLTLRIDTSEVKNHIFKTRVKMSWPNLITEIFENNRTITFPLTQNENLTYRNLTVKNPSNLNLSVQILLEKFYPNVELLYEGLPSIILPKKTERTDNFFIENYDIFPFFTLKPGENRTISIGFRSEKSGSYATLLVVRNNLTVLDLVRLQGKSSEAIFRFGNRKPGGNQPLSFEFTEKHVRNCENGGNNFGIKRTFTARNIGEIPIEIRNFYINNLKCEGYGFKILNCNSHPFILKPNSTRKIEIEFTPDFTLSKIMRTLIIETSCNFQINYTLQVTIPSYYVNLCSKIIKRPMWEYYLHLAAAIMMAIISFGFLIISIIDAEKLKKSDVIFTSQSNNTVIQPVLDLRLLGQQIKEDVQNNREITKNDKKTNEFLEQQKNSNGASVLIPTVGKSKRKLINKKSDEIATTEETKKKDECKKNSQFKEKKINKKKPEDDPPGEFNQTTSNIDEEIKENKCKSNVKKVKTENEENKEEIVKIDRKKISKNSQIPRLKEENMNKKLETKRKRAELKEKSLRKSLEKQNTLKNTEQNQFVQNSTNVNSSNVKQPVWSSSVTENRATFSDVVARTENLNNLLPRTTTSTILKPTMYVEPYKQQKQQPQYQNQPFGPIGTKPIDFWHNTNNEIVQNQKIENINSYFSNYEPQTSTSMQNFHEIRGNNDWIKNDNYCDGTTTRNHRVISDYNILDPWNRNLSTNTLWNDSHSLRSSSMNNTNSNNLQNSNNNGQNNYLWGSSSVWQPWTPLTELSVRSSRIPPGFNNQVIQHRQNNETVSSTVNNAQDIYNPFTSNNLWNQDENIWRYSKDQ